MKTNVWIATISVVWMLFSCTSEKQVTLLTEGDCMVIPFESGVENVKPVKLSDIAEKVAFVPLETTDTSLVARQMLSQIRLANGCIYVPCSEGLLTFDEKTGKFLRRISRKGQGPGEYTSIRGIEILEGSEYVYLFSGEKVLTFQSDGKFLTQYSKPGGWATSVIQDSLCLSFIINHTGQQKYRLLITDEQADTLQCFPQYDRFEVPGGFNWIYHHTLERYLYTYKDEHVFRDYYCDTLFTVKPDKLVPRLRLDMGKYGLPKDLRLEPVMMSVERNNALAKARNYYRPSVFEGGRFVLMPYTTWDISQPQNISFQYLLFDKRTGECLKIENDAIVNDMVGNLPFRPVARVADNVLMAWLEVPYLQEQMEKGIQLPDELKRMKDDDNAVLMLVYLKNE